MWSTLISGENVHSSLKFVAKVVDGHKRKSSLQFNLQLTFISGLHHAVSLGNIEAAQVKIKLYFIILTENLNFFPLHILRVDQFQFDSAELRFRR